MTTEVVAQAPGPLDVLYNLVLEDGRLWGDVAADFQVADAVTIFDPAGPAWHYLTRPRGGSKTTDLAGVSLAWLVTQARPLQRSIVVAISETQATELTDAAQGFVVRTPFLHREVAPEATAFYAKNGAYVQVLTSDGSSAFGKGRDTGFIILDEFAQWPETKKYRRLWLAMLSACQKTPDLRLVILTSAGEPGHFSYDVIREAREGEFRDMWHVSETPGLVPWATERKIRAQNPLMSEDEFARLHLNQWTAAADRLITFEDWDRAALLHGSQARERGKRYIVTVDIGVKDDPTVICVAHAEPMAESPRAKRVVIDHLERHVPGSKARRLEHQEVSLGFIEKRLYDLSVEYGAPIHGDPSQFLALKQSLRLAGRSVKEFKFSPTSVGELAAVLAQGMRNGQVWLPDDEVLRDELLNVRLRSTGPGTYRLDHDPKRHDDQAVCVGMACHLLLGKPGFGSAKAFIEAANGATEIVAKRREARGVARAVRRKGGRRCQHRFRSEPPHDCVNCGALDTTNAA